MISDSSGAPSWKEVVVTCCLIALVAPLLHLAVGESVTVSKLLRSATESLVISNCIGLSATWCGALIWPWFRRQNRTVQASAMVAVLLAAGAAGSLAGCVILTLTGIFPAADFLPIYLRVLRIAMFITFTFGAGAWVFEELRGRLQDTTLQLRTHQLERERAEKLAAAARLSSLESRIHPHFLFNALNSIASLVREDPALAERLIERMAALLRFSLDSAQTGLVPLGQELRVVQDYLEIEKVRFGERLRYSIEMAGGFDSVRVPPMSVQTLVENSLKYAVAPRPEGGSLRIRVFGGADSMAIEVWDDGPGFALESVPEGHGVDNLRSRLEALFGSGAGLTVGRVQSGTSVLLNIPQNLPVAVA
jgi:two-component system, LytTR family, sensor histidine kinase AlgZ